MSTETNQELDDFYADNGSSFILDRGHQNPGPLVKASREILRLPAIYPKSPS